MNTNTQDKYDVTVEVPGSAVPTDRRLHLRRWWSFVTSLIAFAVLIEALFAGAMFSGAAWARTAHSVSAAVLIASTLIAGLISSVTLRHIPDGVKLGLTLLLLATLVFLQAAVGALSAKGANLLWLHVPLGVAVFGVAVRAVGHAPRLT